MTIKPNSIAGFHAKYFIIPIIVLIVGNIAITILIPNVSWYALIPTVGLIIAVIFGWYRFKTQSITLTDNAFVVKKWGKTTTLEFKDVKEVLYTDKYSFGNNVKPALFVHDTANTTPLYAVATSWNHKDIRKLYDAIPEAVAKKQVERIL